MLGATGGTEPLPAGAGNHGRHDPRSEQPGLRHIAGYGRIIRLDGRTRRLLYRHGSERPDAAIAIGASQDRKRSRPDDERINRSRGRLIPWLHAVSVTTQAAERLEHRAEKWIRFSARCSHP